MKLYVVRHGLTNANMEGIYNGLLDEDINEIGIDQANQIRKRIKDIEYDLVFCSSLLRTRHTCDIINVKKKPVIYDERICERTLGYLDGKNLKEYGYEKEILDYNYKSEIENFEDLPTLFKRVHNFIEDIKEKYKDKNILIVTHGGILRAIYFYFNELPENKDLSNYIFKNCEINEYDLKGENDDK